MEILYLIIFFAFGSIMGSFYHVVATRLSNGLSIIKPVSHCEKCKHELKWYELIPIVSYLFLGGRCRKCKVRLPVSYLLMEICTGTLFAVCYHVFDTPIQIAIAIIFVSALIIVIISDIEYMIILDEVLIISVFLIIFLNVIDVGLYATAIKVLSGVLAFVTMLLIKKLGDLIFKQESLGGGDIKLMFLVGMVIGYEMSICNIFLATFIAFPIALILLVTKKDNMIPFGPFLGMAAIILYVWGINFTDIINFILT